MVFVFGLGILSVLYQSNSKTTQIYSDALLDYNNKNFQNSYYLFSKVGFFADLKPYAIYRQALCAKELGDTKSEIKQYQLLFNNYPKNPLSARARYETAQTILDTNPKLAQKYFKFIIKNFPDTDLAIASEYYVGVLRLKKYKDVSKISKSDKNEIEKAFRHYLTNAPQGKHALNAITNWLSLNTEIDKDDYLLMAKANYMYNKNLAETKELLGDRAETMDSQAIGYLAGNLELEKAMVYLLDRLEEAGQLDKTVIVLTGDHTPYYLSPAGKESILGHPADENFEIYHSTCIMYNAGMEEPIETDTYCCNVDILPTILNLFGIEYESRLLMGRDIFSDGIHRARLYNGSFINDKVMYNSKTGEVTWLADTSDLSEEETDAYLNAMIDYTEGEYAASVKLLASNYYFFVWKNSGMLTDEEIAAETTREFMATNRAAEELLAEQEAAALAAALEAQAAEGATEDGGQAQPEPQPEY